MFRYLFDVEISKKIFDSLFSSFHLKAPVTVRHSTIDSHLDKVQDLIASLRRPMSIHDIMSKCAFLIFFYYSWEVF